MSLATILSAIVTHLQSMMLRTERLTSGQMREVIDYITRLQELVDGLQKLKLNDREYAYMKAIALFSGEELCTMPLSGGRMTQAHPALPVRAAQQLAIQELRQYLHQKSNQSPENDGSDGEPTVEDIDLNKSPEPAVERMAQLLLTLRSLKSLAKSITEELFFSGLIGEVQIDSVIPFILRMDSNDAGHSDTSNVDSPPNAGERLRTMSASSPGRSSGSGNTTTAFGLISLVGGVSPESTASFLKK
jgi:hypothetical protein